MIKNVNSHEEIIKAALENPLAFFHQIDISLFEFMQIFWDTVSEDPFHPNWHIPYLCEELEQVARLVGENTPKEYDLIINIPPGTTKTITVSIMFPVWCWTKWPHFKFICSSYSSALSLESADKCRNIIRSNKFKTFYPYIGIKEDKDTKSNFQITHHKIDPETGKSKGFTYGGNRFSTSVGGTMTGFHGHILIVDDPLNPQQAASEVELEKANTWIDQTLSTRKTNKAVTPTIMVMQRLHQNDPSGYLLGKEKKVIKHICLPGEIRKYGDFLKPKDLRKKYQDDLLDPVRLDWSVLEELETDLGQFGYAGQIGQNPVPPGGGMFRVDQIPIIRSYDKSSVVQEVRYWDKAATADAGAYTVGVRLARMTDGTFLVVDVIRGQWSTDTRERMIRRIAELDGKKVHIGVEQEPGSGGKDSIRATIKNLAGFHVESDRPVGDKIVRADPLSVQVNNTNVSLLAGEWNRAFIDELRFFPFGTFKDQVDATSGAFSMLTKKRLVRRIR